MTHNWKAHWDNWKKRWAIIRMKITYKEKSFLDQDIEIYDDSNLLIAQINYGILGYVLHYESEEYYMMTKGWLGLNESIVRIKDKIEFLSIHSQYDIPSTSKLSKNEEIYFYEQSFLFGKKYKFINRRSGWSVEKMI